MKRKILPLLVALCLALALFPAVPAAAASPVNVTINGVPVRFNQDTGVPFIDSNGRTQVPLRAAMEAMGADVGWNNYDRAASVVRGDKCVIVPIGQSLIYVNGKEKENNTEAQIKDGRTYLPIRIVAESLGATVDWTEESRTVSIQIGESIGSQNVPELYQLIGEPLSSIYSILGYNCTAWRSPDSYGAGVEYEEQGIAFVLPPWEEYIDVENTNTYYHPQNIVGAVASTNDYPIWKKFHGQMMLSEVTQSIEQGPCELINEGASDSTWSISFYAIDTETSSKYAISYLWDKNTYPGSYAKPSVVFIMDDIIYMEITMGTYRP